MKIECPECGFSREVPEDRLPAGAVMATCPRCSCRFRLERAGAAEEDPRLAASLAYAREASRLERDVRGAGSSGDSAGSADLADAQPRNAWQAAPGEIGWFASFAQTLLAVLFQPQRFFQSLAPVASQLRPFCFYAILGVFQTLCERFWLHVFVGALSPGAEQQQMEGLAAMLDGGGNLPLSLLLRGGALCLQLYFTSALVFLTVRLIAPERASFSLVFQVFAYSFAPAVLCIAPGVGSLIGMIWGAGLMVAGLRLALGLPWRQTMAAFLPLLFIAVYLLSRVVSLVQG